MIGCVMAVTVFFCGSNRRQELTGAGDPQQFCGRRASFGGLQPAIADKQKLALQFTSLSGAWSTFSAAGQARRRTWSGDGPIADAQSHLGISSGAAGFWALFMDGQAKVDRWMVQAFFKRGAAAVAGRRP
jgi:hypothetical protein